MKLTHKVELSTWCYAVAQHNGLIYVGGYNSVHKIDRRGQPSNAISVHGYVHGIDIAGGKMYLLVHYRGWRIAVYNLNYDFITSWDHPDVCSYNKLAVNHNSVLISLKNPCSIIRYGTEGQTSRTIRCDHMNNSDRSILHTADPDLVIGRSGDCVFAFNLRSRKTMWTNNTLNKPDGLTYQDDKLYVAVGGDSKNNSVDILDARSG